MTGRDVLRRVRTWWHGRHRYGVVVYPDILGMRLGVRIGSGWHLYEITREYRTTYDVLTVTVRRDRTDTAAIP